MRFLLLLIISFFFVFPSYAYDEKIKLIRNIVDTDSKKESIKISLNEMLDLKKIKDASRKIVSTQNYTKAELGRIIKRGKRKKYKGVAVNIYKNNVGAVVYLGNKKDNGVGTGSIISKDGQIITNWHIIPLIIINI